MENLARGPGLSSMFHGEPGSGSDQHRRSRNSTGCNLPTLSPAATAWKSLIIGCLSPFLLNRAKRNLFMSFDFTLQKLHKKDKLGSTGVASHEVSFGCCLNGQVQ